METGIVYLTMKVEQVKEINQEWIWQKGLKLASTTLRPSSILNLNSHKNLDFNKNSFFQGLLIKVKPSNILDNFFVKNLLSNNLIILSL